MGAPCKNKRWGMGAASSKGETANQTQSGHTHTGTTDHNCACKACTGAKSLSLCVWVTTQGHRLCVHAVQGVPHDATRAAEAHGYQGTLVPYQYLPTFLPCAWLGALLPFEEAPDANVCIHRVPCLSGIMQSSLLVSPVVDTHCSPNVQLVCECGCAGKRGSHGRNSTRRGPQRGI